MNSFVKFSLVLAVVISAVCAMDDVLSDDLVASYSKAYELYKIKFKKHYTTKEENDEHLRAYATSMERIKKFYKEHPDAKVVFGETSRSDLLDKQIALNPLIGKGKRDRKGENVNTFPQPKLAKDHTDENIPDEFNWLDVPGVNHKAKDQGECGCCWAVSATSALEMQSVLEGNEYHEVSPQQLIDCVSGDSDGCCGGESYQAWEDIQDFTSEEQYPYTLHDWEEGVQQCKPNECEGDKDVVVSIRGYDKFVNMNAEQLKKELWMYGPLTISMLVPKEFFDYVSGVLDCSNFTLPNDGHAVLAVGYGKDYIRIRNSWGDNWGLHGDFLVSDKSYQASCAIVSSEEPITRVSAAPESYSSSASSSLSSSSVKSSSSSTPVAKSSSTPVDKSAGSIAAPFSFVLAFLFSLMLF